MLLQAMVHVQIVPMACAERRRRRLRQAASGCGPFRFVEGRLDDRVVMERFDDYRVAPRHTARGPAKVRRVIFRSACPTVRVLR